MNPRLLSLLLLAAPSGGDVVEVAPTPTPSPRLRDFVAPEPRVVRPYVPPGPGHNRADPDKKARRKRQKAARKARRAGEGR